MKIERKTAGDVTLLAFTGEFDAFNLPTISEKLDNLIQTGVKKLVFNLRLLKFINSSALGYLIKTHKRLKEIDGELVLSEPSKFFQSTITTLGITFHRATTNIKPQSNGPPKLKSGWKRT